MTTAFAALALGCVCAGNAFAFDAGGVESDGKINAGADTQVPSGAPPGVMAQSGAGDTVENKASPVGNAQAGAPAETPVPDPEQANAAPAPANGGPIGATAQTMPAKISERNDKLDHLPMMAEPLPFTDDQKQRIAQAVRNDAHPALNLTATPAMQVPAGVEIYPLPDAVAAQIPDAAGYRVLKLKDKVVLVNPGDRAVVGEIKE
jgi:hypothetical protein